MSDEEIQNFIGKLAQIPQSEQRGFIDDAKKFV